MAPTPDPVRAALADLTVLAQDALLAVWRDMAGADADSLRDALMASLPHIGGQYGDLAATVAVDQFLDLREQAEARGSFVPEPAATPNSARYEALTRWGLSPLYRADPDANAALTLISGGLQRIVADAHRLTIVEATQADSEATGWRRVGVGRDCGFCRMLLDRGAVYTETSVEFRSHDHCNCAAAPTWAQNVVKVSREPYRQSRRNRSEATKRADNARAREYIADKYGAN